VQQGMYCPLGDYWFVRV